MEGTSWGDLAVVIGDPDNRDKSYGYEAVQLALAFASGASVSRDGKTRATIISLVSPAKRVYH